MEPQHPASFGSEEDFPIDSILATMLKEDKSEEDKQNGWSSKCFLAYVNSLYAVVSTKVATMPIAITGWNSLGPPG